MKNVKYISILLVGLLLSCNSLNLAPEDNFSSSNFWQNQAEVDAFMNGIHNAFRNRQTNLLQLGEWRGDQYVQNNIINFSVTVLYNADVTNNITPNTVDFDWSGFYADIMRINLFIQQVDKTTFLSAADKGYYMGQAYGLRAFYYFSLLKAFGGVPIVTDPKVVTSSVTDTQAFYKERSTEKETMDFIKSDIDKSMTNFGTNFSFKATKGKWSKAATLMLKADVYLWNAKVIDKTAADLTPALDALNQINSSGAFSLRPNFADVFSYANKGNSEIIFAVRNQINESQSGQFAYYTADLSYLSLYDRNGKKFTDVMDIVTTTTNAQVIARMQLKYSIFQKFDVTDSRRDATFLDMYSAANVSDPNTKKSIAMLKFLGAKDANKMRWFSDDVPVYRYAEYYLLLAEIKNYMGQDPTSEINAIRQRAYGSNWNIITYGYKYPGNFAQCEKDILNEREKEFICEGKRFYDLRRMTTATGSAGLPLIFQYVPEINAAQYKLVWPISMSVRTNDPTVKQNPGYNEAL